ncbi:MAG: gamma-butyrobetaine hydroxylase-like domain-containing protein [Terriglobia bacterium]
MPPIPTKIKVDAGDGTLAIEWLDGHASHYGYQYLRDRCPCATCTGAEGHNAGSKTPDAIPMFKKALRPERAEVVGRYAVQIFWNDGHSTGIYTFPYLRGLCPCQECGRQP